MRKPSLSLPHFVFFLADGQSRRSGFHQKTADAFAPWSLFVGYGPDHEHPGIGGAGYKDLGTVKDIGITLLDGSGAHPGRVGTGTVLGEAKAAGRILAGTDFGDILAFLFFGANGLDHLTDHVVDRNRDRGGGAGPGNFRHSHAEGHYPGLGAAVLIADVESHETQFRQLLEVGQQGGAILFLVQLGGHWLQFGPGKITGRILDQFLFFG